jgi:acyl transferase domain-containing protein
VSTVTGRLLTDEQAIDPAYWAEQARRPVRFSEAIETLHQEPHRVYLEVGPGRTLTGAVIQHPDRPDGTARVAVVHSLGHPTEGRPALATMLGALGELWQSGVAVSPAVVYQDERPRRVHLPTYPFQRQRHWVDPPAPTGTARAPLPPRRATQQATGDPGSTSSSRVPVATQRPSNGANGHHGLADQLIEILARLGGLEPAAIDPNAAFTDLGFDSLSLTAANAEFRKRLGLRVTLAQLLGEASSVAALAALIEGDFAPDAARWEDGARADLPPMHHLAGTAERVPSTVAEAEDPDAAAGHEVGPSADQIESLIAEQLRIMERQLEIVRDHVVRGTYGADTSAGAGVRSSGRTTVE